MASVHDMKTARATYDGFLSLIKIAAPVVAAITALVIYLLTH